jgi:ElaB/YqjD/DUF883 family membrane-anchored ribosome-binding protein
MVTTRTKAAAAPKARAAKAPAAKSSAPKASAAKAATPTARKPAVKPKPLKAETETLRDQASTLFGQAGDKVRSAATSGKNQASGAMGDMAAMVEDVAKTLDEKVGAQYGDYARKAASAVAGVANTLQSKEVDQLLDDARDFVRKKPAIAIGAAAAVGFVLTRLIKAGTDDEA